MTKVQEYCFEVGFALRWIAPRLMLAYQCPQLMELAVVEQAFSPYQLEALSLGQQIAFPIRCGCGYDHWCDALYNPMYEKMHRLDEELPIKELLRQTLWRS